MAPTRMTPAQRTCSHPGGCGRPQVARGWCHMHYRRVQKTGDPGPSYSLTTRNTGGCAVEGCSNPFLTRGLCGTHYARLRECIGQEQTIGRRPEGICAVDGCPRPEMARALCSAHHHRLIRHGHPLEGRPPLALDHPSAGCDRGYAARGYCLAHYKQWRRGGEPRLRPRSRHPGPREVPRHRPSRRAPPGLGSLEGRQPDRLELETEAARGPLDLTV